MESCSACWLGASLYLYDGRVVISRSRGAFCGGGENRGKENRGCNIDQPLSMTPRLLGNVAGGWKSGFRAQQISSKSGIQTLVSPSFKPARAVPLSFDFSRTY